MTSKKFVNDEARLAKNASIAASRKATKDRRAAMKCQVFHLKIVTNKSSKTNQRNLDLVFKQAKWLKNHILSLESVNDYLPSKQVPVITPDGLDNRELSLLGSQVAQSVFDQVRSDIKALAASKSKGRKVGKLKFVKSVSSLNLKQVGSTYRFNDTMNKVKIQGLPAWYRVRGAQQLDGMELANAKLLRKADGYYLAVTAYSIPRVEINDQELDSLGVDFGVKTHLTLCDGREFNVMIMETDRLRRLQRKLSRQVKGSNNYHKTRELIQKEYLKLSRLKDETSNKIISGLLKEAKVIYFQDDNFNSWKSRKSFARGGKAIQHSILGRVKQKMLANESRFKRVDRYAPTSKTCVCGVVNKSLTLADRWFNCLSCGYSAPRDVHAAGNMKNFYSPVERGSALVEELSGSLVEQVPLKQEIVNFEGSGVEAAKSLV